MRRFVLWISLLCSVILIPSATAQFVYLPQEGGNPGTDSGTVAVINTVTNVLTATVNVGVYPLGSALNPAGTRVYIANQGSNTVSVINTANNTVIATINVGQEPTNLVVNPAGTRLYVANLGGMTISVIDTSSDLIVATIPVPSDPSAITITPDGTKLYVGSYVQGGDYRDQYGNKYSHWQHW
jgi:YVTN family beta-propeller protein